jgi:glycosyltransferase involved in cell wall biosynthesis
MYPEVSICIPAYKQIEFLRRTLKSVLEQSFADYEIIISDDSPDDSVKKLLEDFDFRGKLRYFKNTPPLGSPSNWNYSIEKAKGKYIKLLHHDDFFTSPESLHKFVSLLDNSPHASFAFSGTKIWFVALNEKKNHWCSQSQLKKIKRNPDQLFFANYIGSPSATIVRQNNNIVYDVNLKWLVDIDYYIQLLKEKTDIVNTTEELICTVHGAEGQATQSLIENKEIQVKEHVYLFSKLFSPAINKKKYALFFQLLFHRYDLQSLEELNDIYPVSKDLEIFFSKVFELKENNIFFKKTLYWVNKTGFNDYLFMMKKFFR